MGRGRRIRAIDAAATLFGGSAGVTLAREGESVGGSYRVVSIDQDFVTLETVSDGSTLRLSLTKP